jgi:hypothetical protein
MMAPRSLEYYLDLYSILRMDPRQTMRELRSQAGNPNAASLATFTFNGIR